MPINQSGFQRVQNAVAAVATVMTAATQLWSDARVKTMALAPTRPTEIGRTGRPAPTMLHGCYVLETLPGTAQERGQNRRRPAHRQRRHPAPPKPAT